MAIVTILPLSLSAPALAQSNTITMIIGVPTGGAYDVYGRLVARHLGQHLPNKPAITVRNMPGAGGLVAANFLYNSAPKDGSTIGTFSRGVPVQPLFDPEGVRYDATKFNWLGSPAQDISVMFSWHTTSFKTLDDVLQREMTVGATGTTGDTVTFALAMNRLLGTKLKIVTGYPGNGDYFLAIERGELDGGSATSWSNLNGTRGDWISGKKINVLLQLGVQKRDGLDAPLIVDLAKNDLDRSALELIFARQLFAYPFAAPPDVPPQVAANLRDAFSATMIDPAFLAEAAKLGLEISPTSGAKLRQLITGVFDASPAVIQRAREATKN